jgi:PAS domain S-box-containing protein
MIGRDMPDVNAPKPRILFVEDEATVREHLASKLSDEYEVDTAGNGNEALLAVMRAKPILVVTDIVMPDMDGVELLKTLRESPGTRAIPVLMISGRATDEHRIEGFEQGADGFLAKPYTERELRAHIRSMLRSAQLRADIIGRDAPDRAEQSVLVERAKLLESIADGFYVLDAELRFTYVNQRALDFYEEKRTHLLGRAFFDVFPTERGSELEARFKSGLRDLQPATFETVALHNGRWIEVHVHPTSKTLAVQFHDVSRRKALESELQAALTQLRRLERQS